MLDQIQGLNIEPTNMCTLKCPRCSRTEFIDQFPNKWSNKNLNLDHLKSFLDIDLTNKKILLCGNYGDPIYYDHLFEMIEYFKLNGAHIQLVTNGSYKTVEWWETLGQLLDQQDEIIFSIDGTPNNFKIYRINADWPSISTGIEALRQLPVKLTWKYILFSYNENDVDQTRALANDLGFDQFLLVDSDRWDHGTEWLTPSNTSQLSQSKIHWKQGNTSDIDPLCKKHHTSHYISADGFYAPCCAISEYRWYYKSEFYKNKDRYDISKTTITEILQSTETIKFYKSIETEKPECCVFSCSKI